MILALISLLVQGVQHFRQQKTRGEVESRTAVGVTITNVPEPAPQRVYVRETTQPATPPIYGVAKVVEENELMPIAAALVLGKWNNPLPQTLR